MEFSKVIGMASEMLKLLSENGGTINDWRYLPIYNEFVDMRKNRVKYRVAVEELSAKYKISKTQIERAIRRFRKEIG